MKTIVCGTTIVNMMFYKRKKKQLTGLKRDNPMRKLHIVIVLNTYT